MLHIIYRTTNKVNGKFYIGKHTTNNLNDGYLGSGKFLKLAIQKYGKHNFVRETLCILSDEEHAYELEELLIDDDLVLDRNCYNMKVGGKGQPKGHVIKNREKRWGLPHKEESKKKIGNSQIGALNHKAVPFLFEDPKGVQYTVYGFKAFCKEKNLSITMMKKNVGNGKIAATTRRGFSSLEAINSVGWSVSRL